MQNVDLVAERKEILNRYGNLIRSLKPNTSSQDKRLIRKAFNLAMEAHKDMRRRTGEPYIYHPIAVAMISVQEIGLGTTSVICSLLHDVVEDTDYTLTDLSGLFGEKVAKICDGLTKIAGIFDQHTSSQAESMRKMLLTLSDDVRVILIKLADRLHNMRTLDAMPREKQLKIASETLFLYAPLAHRLGLYAIKTELEDLGLKYTDTEIYNTINQKLEDSATERGAYINDFVAPIKKVLAERGFRYEIFGRPKSIFSIWNKMKKKEIPFEEVFDLFAIRIIIDTPKNNEIDDCWRVYAMITQNYRPNPDRLRDWISTPKGNGYESLHTTVMGAGGKWVEVQIRSKRMDEIAEKGYAAHWKYKDAVTGESNLEEWLKKIRELLESPEANAFDFIEDFKLNLFADEIIAFTPKGDMKNLPGGSTALDFAYSIHSRIGATCIGAKVNHKLVPLSHKLKSGDQIEIITSSKQKPQEEWLNYVVTSRAKSRIKDALKDQKKLLSDEGSDILKTRFEKLKYEYNSENINKLLTYLKIPNQVELFFKVAQNEVTLRQVRDFIKDTEKGNWYNAIRKGTKKITSDISSPLEKFLGKITKKTPTSSEIEAIGNFDYSISSCCNPIPGDDVFGFSTDNDGIKIHRTNCQVAIQLLSKFGNKIVKAKWTPSEEIAFLAGIKLTGIDEIGMMNRITRVISKEHNVNMKSLSFDSNDGTFEGYIMVYVHNTDHLMELMKNLKKIKGIEQLIRVDKI